MSELEINKAVNKNDGHRNYKGTIIGVDFGLKQTGIALLHMAVGMATPLTVLRSKNDKPDWQGFEKIIREWQPEHCIVGLPLNMDGTESPMCDKVKKFCRQVEGRFQLTYELHDERLTSFEAKQQMQESSNSRDYHDTPADSLAAQLILQQWLELYQSQQA